MSERWEKDITENEAEMQELQTRIWSAQEPQEQLQKKANKGQRHKKKQPELLGQIKQDRSEEKVERGPIDSDVLFTANVKPVGPSGRRKFKTIVSS